MLYSNSSPLFLYNERQRLEIKCLVPSHRMWPVTRSWTSQLMLKTCIPHQLFPGLKKSFQATIFLQFGKLNFKKIIIIIAKHMGFIRSLWIETDDRSLFFFASLSPSIAVFLCAQNKQPRIFFSCPTPPVGNLSVPETPVPVQLFFHGVSITLWCNMLVCFNVLRLQSKVTYIPWLPQQGGILNVTFNAANEIIFLQVHISKSGPL